MEKRLHIFDTTLRDGEQSPGCSMNLEEKVRMARKLEELGVDVIEAGFPVASQGDFEAVRSVARTIRQRSVAALARALRSDIDRAWEAIRDAVQPRIHVFIATSDIHMKHKLNKTRSQVLADTLDTVRYARSLCSDVEFSCEDASRSDLVFLSEVIRTAIGAGATVINLPDTVGYATPAGYGAMFRAVRNAVPETCGIILSAHCHNDLGLAVANSLAAIESGVLQVECTVNGIGERAGNAALEELIMALRTRKDAYKTVTSVNTEEIYASSKLLSELTGMQVQRNKAIVGANAFSHEAGIHQDGMLKNAMTYEIMTPQSVGIRHSILVLGKHSGRHAVKQRCTELGYDLSQADLDRVYGMVCNLADRKKEVFDEDLIALLDVRDVDHSELYHLDGIQVSSGTNMMPTATVALRYGGRKLADSATGDGPVDALYKAIERLTGVAGMLMEYKITSVSAGRDAMGEVSVRVDFGGVVHTGRAISTDVVTGSATAYLEALNRALVAQKRKNGQSRSEHVSATATAV